MRLVDSEIIHVYLCNIGLIVLIWFYLLDLKRNSTKRAVEVMRYARCFLLYLLTVLP